MKGAHGCSHLELDFSWDVDVEEMNLAVHRDEFACEATVLADCRCMVDTASTLGIVHRARIVHFSVIALRNRPCVDAQYVHLLSVWKYVPPMIHVLTSFATEDSICTLSLALVPTSYALPGVYPIVSAYTGKCVWPYGELKHSYANYNVKSSGC